MRDSQGLTKKERFAQGLPLACKWHGEHSEWRLHTGNNVKCLRCSRDHAKQYIARNYLKYLVSWSKRRDAYSEVTSEFILELLKRQNNACALTGIEFTKKVKPSLDRIDSSKGYSKENVHLVVFDVNRMKTDLPLNDFRFLCNKVAAWEPEYGLSGC